MRAASSKGVHSFKSLTLMCLTPLSTHSCQVPLLNGLTPYERATLTDALVPLTFQPDQIIVRQGDLGDTFYLIEEGEVVVLRQDPGQPAPAEVNRLRPPQFFGEVALLSSQHERRATVMAVNGAVRLLALDHAAFTRLLGPLEDIMQRNTEQYHLVEAPATAAATAAATTSVGSVPSLPTFTYCAGAAASPADVSGATVPSTDAGANHTAPAAAVAIPASTTPPSGSAHATSSPVAIVPVAPSSTPVLAPTASNFDMVTIAGDGGGDEE